jgi:hypothetical protein
MKTCFEVELHGMNRKACSFWTYDVLVNPGEIIGLGNVVRIILVSSST